MLKVRPPLHQNIADAKDIVCDIRAKLPGGIIMSCVSYPFRLALIASLAIGVAACSSGDPSAVKQQKDASGARSRMDIYSGVGGKGQETGSLFGPGGLFGGKDKKETSDSGVAVNAFLWRASLDTINFIPLVSADPFGGVIITDWYTPQETPNERMKVQITILDRELRADGVRVSVFKQQASPKGGGWVDAQVDPHTNTDIENAILTRARQLRIAQGGS